MEPTRSTNMYRLSSMLLPLVSCINGARAAPSTLRHNQLQATVKYAEFQLDISETPTFAERVDLIDVRDYVKNGEASLNVCRDSCSAVDECIGWLYVEDQTAQCTTVKSGTDFEDLGSGFSRIAWRYTSRPGESCEAGIDSIKDTTGRCECGPQRNEVSSFGCVGITSPLRTLTRRQESAPGYQDFPLIVSVDDVFYAEPLGLLEFYTLEGAGETQIEPCRQLCSSAPACIGFHFFAGRFYAECVTLQQGTGTADDLTNLGSQYTLISWRYDVPTGPVCRSGLDIITNPNGQCSCAATDVQNTAYGCQVRAVAPSQAAAFRKRGNTGRIMPGISKSSAF